MAYSFAPGKLPKLGIILAISIIVSALVFRNILNESIKSILIGVAGTSLAVGIVYTVINLFTDNGDRILKEKAHIALFLILSILIALGLYKLPFLENIIFIRGLNPINASIGALWIILPIEIKYFRYLGWFFIWALCAGACLILGLPFDAILY